MQEKDGDEAIKEQYMMSKATGDNQTKKLAKNPVLGIIIELFLQ